MKSPRRSRNEADNQGLTPDTARSSGQGLVEGAKTIASEAVDTAKETAQNKAQEKGLPRTTGSKRWKGRPL